VSWADTAVVKVLASTTVNGESTMPRVLITHPVGNMETWLAGGEERKAMFKKFSSAYRIYRHAKENKIAIVWENVDMPKLEALLKDPETDKAKARHTVREPGDIYIEVERGL
jgi:hypothetical protein